MSGSSTPAEPPLPTDGTRHCSAGIWKHFSLPGTAYFKCLGCGIVTYGPTTGSAQVDPGMTPAPQHRTRRF